MKNAGWLSVLFVAWLISGSVWAQSSGAKPKIPRAADLDITVTNAQQKWRNAMEYMCRMPRESYPTFQQRINARMQIAGNNGWELVSLGNGVIPGYDCFAIGYKQPDKSN